jgi:hypothetical protein
MLIYSIIDIIINITLYQYVNIILNDIIIKIELLISTTIIHSLNYLYQINMLLHKLCIYNNDYNINLTLCPIQKVKL